MSRQTLGPARVADRFLRLGAHAALDLASGDQVWLSLFDARSRERLRARWDRCAALFGIWHPCLADLIDYGITGAATAFEAWRLPGVRRPWAKRDASTASALASAVRFLHARGLSAGRLAWSRIVERGGKPALAPDAGMGLPLGGPGGVNRAGFRLTGRVEQERLRNLIAACRRSSARVGIERRATLSGSARPAGHAYQPDAAVAQVVELLDGGRHGEPRQIHLSGPAGVERTMAVRMIAREARLRGYVPLSTAGAAAAAGSGDAPAPRLVDPFLRDRHVLIIDWLDEIPGGIPDLGPRTLLELCSASARPHLLLSVHSAGPGERLRLEAAVRGTRTSWAIKPAAVTGSRVGESSPSYGPRSVADPSCRLAAAREGQAGALHRARARGADGIRLARQGRHAEGERLIREALGSLARRRDDAWAGLAALDLGRVLLWRGRVRDAAQAFAEARSHFDRARVPAASTRAAIFVGLAWTDLARLTDAEAVLRSACIAAREQRDVPTHAFASLSLARCLLWQARWDDAASAVRDTAPQVHLPSPDADVAPGPALVCETALWGEPGGPGRREPWIAAQIEHDLDVRVMEACLEARIALGRRDFPAAGMSVTRALDRAQRCGQPREFAAAHTVAAALHGEISDVDGLRRHVAQGLQAAAQAHVPLQAVRLRLLLVGGLRRAGRTGEGDRLAARLSRIKRDHLPPLLRASVEALARGDARSPCSLPLLAAQPPRPGPMQPDPGSTVPSCVIGNRPELVADIVNLLGSCHDVADDATMLERVAGLLRQQARAASVAFFGLEAGGLTVLACAGCRPAPLEVARRAGDSGLCIEQCEPAEGMLAAVPVRYAGAVIGALGCRWAIGVDVDRDRVVALLSTAAMLAAPGVRASLDRRACPVAIMAAEPGLLGLSAPMTALRAAIARAAGAPFPVLIEGESGSGKELVARAIHRAGPRRDRKFCALNCAALTDELLEAELFGHARGAFTGALADRPGLFEEADGGTMVLDEVGELSPRAQAKLLRFLQEGEVRRVGENVMRWVDVRVIAAANRPLEGEVAAGRFRRDLFYRLNVIHVAVPALRDRIDDIPLLAGHFWAQAIGHTGSRATLSPETLSALARHDWPGNVRELQNVLAALAVAAPRRGSVGPGTLPAALVGPAEPVTRTTLDEARRVFEQRHVRAALAQCGGHRGRTARDLGLSRQGFAKLLVRLRIDLPSAD